MQNIISTLKDVALFIMWSDHTGVKVYVNYITDVWAKTKIWNTEVYHLITIVFWDQASAFNINSGNVMKEPSDTLETFIHRIVCVYRKLKKVHQNRNISNLQNVEIH